MTSISIIIPPVSDCFMPTLGAAQIKAYLSQKAIPTKLYDLSAELQNLILCQAGYNTIPSHTSAIEKFNNSVNILFNADSVRFKISYDSFESEWNWRKPDRLCDLLSIHAKLIKYLDRLSSISEISNSSYAAFSISYESQVIPALLIAALLWERNKISSIFGGSFFYTYAKTFANSLRAFDFVKYLIVGPGEIILERIAKGGFAQEFQSPIFDKGILQQPATDSYPQIYFPDFKDLDFSYYFSQAKAFPYIIHNTCYYGYCKFCNGDRTNNILQNKDVNIAFKSMADISKNINIYNIYIVDAALSPRDFSIISDIQYTIPFSWVANARFEKILIQTHLLQKLFHKGCRMLRLGLESGSQQVLNKMRKGTDISLAAKILKNLHNAGILTHIYLMLGYPCETNTNRYETIRFLEHNKQYIDSYSLSIFQPIPGTPVYEEMRERLTLIDSGNCDEIYQHIVDEVYKSEKDYQNILDTVENVKNILSGYSKTNIEFYSANIFSDSYGLSTGSTDLSIQFMPGKVLSKGAYYEKR